MDLPKHIPTKLSPSSWTTRDIVVTAALAVATGISFIVFDWIYLLLSYLIGPLSQSIMEGLWLLGSLLVPYIVRRPGSALFGELVASLVEASFNPFGISVIIAGLLEGVGAELIFLLTGYKRFDWKVMALAGGFNALFFFWTRVVWTSGFLVLSAGSPVLKIAPVVFLTYMVVETISGALAGWLGKAIGDALIPTGALDGFPIAAGRHQDV
ncbi:MAG TPA: ECF transporter S component [Chloroflexota bacterium]|nr:ECF transporter S component [Chloroflexota bacterium]